MHIHPIALPHNHLLHPALNQPDNRHLQLPCHPLSRLGSPVDSQLLILRDSPLLIQRHSQVSNLLLSRAPLLAGRLLVPLRYPPRDLLRPLAVQQDISFELNLGVNLDLFVSPARLATQVGVTIRVFHVMLVFMLRSMAAPHAFLVHSIPTKRTPLLPSASPALLDLSLEPLRLPQRDSVSILRPILSSAAWR